jgi:hypothetical protein
MKKNKSKKSKASQKPTLLGGAAKSIKKLGKGTANRIGGLSTTQKVIGGTALVALGLNYLSKRRAKASASASSVETAPDDATVAEESLAAMDANA